MHHLQGHGELAQCGPPSRGGYTLQGERLSFTVMLLFLDPDRKHFLIFLNYPWPPALRDEKSTDLCRVVKVLAENSLFMLDPVSPQWGDE